MKTIGFYVHESNDICFVSMTSTFLKWLIVLVGNLITWARLLCIIYSINICTCLEGSAQSTQDVESLWTKHFKAGQNSAISANCHFIDKSKNHYVAGNFLGTVDLDPGVGNTNTQSNGGTDAFVMELDSNGLMKWEVHFGERGDESINEIFVDDISKDIYIVGSFSSAFTLIVLGEPVYINPTNTYNSFIIRISGVGDFIDARQLNDATITSLAMDSRRNICLSGTFSKTVDFDPSKEGEFLITAKNSTLTESNNFISKWSRTFDFIWAIQDSLLSYGVDLKLDAQDNIYVLGKSKYNISIKKYTKNGEPIWNNGLIGPPTLISMNPYSLAVGPNGTVYVVGDFTEWIGFPDGGSYVTKKNARAGFIAQMGSGEQGSIFVLADAGASTKAHSAYCTDVDIDNKGNVYVTGGFSGSISFEEIKDQKIKPPSLLSSDERDMFIIKFGENPNYGMIWAKSIQGTGFETGASIKIDNHNNVFVIGRFNKQVDVDPNSGQNILTSISLGDLFLQKMVPKTNCQGININFTTSASNCELSNFIIASTTGAISPVKYLWSNGSKDAILFNVPLGQHTLTVTDFFGCTTSKSITVACPTNQLPNDNPCGAKLHANKDCYYIEGTNFNSTTTLSPDSKEISCSKSSIKDVWYYFESPTDGIIDVNVKPGTIKNLKIAIYTKKNTSCTDLEYLSCLEYKDGAIARHTIDNPKIGLNYVVRIWSQTGEEGTFEICVTYQDNRCGTFSFGINTTKASCNLANGTASATVKGGQMPYTFKWNTGATTPNLSGLAAGNYSLTVTDKNGCTTSESTIIQDQICVQIYDPVCGSDGKEYANSCEAECAGVSWTKGPCSTGSICDSFRIDPNPITPAIFYPCDTQPYSVSVTGGKAPYQYKWSNGSTTTTIPGSQPGTYMVTITDANQCTLTDTIVVPKIDKPQVEIKAEPLSGCNTNSRLIAHVKPGKEPITNYIWSDGQNGAQITVNKSGIYAVTVVDEIGCEASAQIEVKITDTLSLKTAITNANCSTLGQASVTASGGTMPYTYRWSNGEQTQNITNLAPGSYTVTVSDAKGCTNTATVTITLNDTNCNVYDDPCGRALTVNANCNYVDATNANAKLTASVSSSNLCAANSDMKDIWFQFVAPTSERIIIESQAGTMTDGVMALYRKNSACSDLQFIACDDDSGEGTMPYLTRNDLVAGQTYLIRYWGYGGSVGTFKICVRKEEVTCPTINVSTNVINTSCNQNNGITTAVASGGTIPYTYLWSNGSTGATISNLATGEYTVTATDDKGCKGTGKAIIGTATVNMSALITETKASCPKDNGSITATATGGTTPYTYKWSNGSLNQTLSNIPAGTYTVTATDSRGCQATSSITVVAGVCVDIYDPVCGSDGKEYANSCEAECAGVSWTKGRCISICDSFQIDPSPITVAIFYPCDTKPYTIPVIGGKEPYQYKWSNGNTSSSVPGSRPGTYTVTVTDANQCTLTHTIVVPKIDKPQVEIKAEPLSGCNTGYKLIANVKIGKAPIISYFWSDGQKNQQITVTKTGVYTVTVTDEIGCEVNAQIEVKMPDALVIRTTITNADCSPSGQASVSASGGMQPYTYRWSTGATSSNIINLSAGIYSVTVSDARKCETTTTLSVGGSVNNLRATFSIKEYICDRNKGAITTSISGGAQPYTFKWSTGATTQNLSNLSPGSYSLTVSDQNKCSIVQTLTLKDRVCVGIYDPVCGSDGNEYANSCEAECAGVTWTKGPCSSNSSCKCSDPAAASICEDFQSYTTTSPSLDGIGILGPQSACWTTWSGSEGGAEDGVVRHLGDGRKYLRIQRSSSTTAQDVVMLFGNRTAGSYQLKFKFLIYPQDKGYFNILNVFTPGAGNSAVRAEEVYFTGNGAGYIKISGQSNVNFSYTTSSGGIWIDIVQDFDLNTGLTKLTIDNKVVHQWTMARKTLRGINFYTADASYRFFVDDISFTQKEDCICPAVYDPVCGADGNTYSNACAANCAGVSIVPCVVCTPPAVSASQITTSTARLALSLPPNTQGSEIRVRQKGTSTWTLINLNTGVSSIGLSSLSPNTSYEYQARVKCSSTVYSNYSNLQEFKTSAASSSDLIAYYPFSGNANDASGNNLHGTVNGAQLTTDRNGRANSAYQFNGLNQFISVTDHVLLDIGTKDYTLMAWIKTSSSNVGRIISKGSSGCSTGYMIRTGGTGGSKVHLENSALSSCRINYFGNTTINDGRWHCVVGTVSRNGGANIYVDGVLDRQMSLNTSNLDLSNSVNLTIGVSHAAGLPEWFSGSIDEVKLYNRALTAQEVATQCQTIGGIGGSTTSALKVYPNPFSRETELTVEYDASQVETDKINIEILDAVGRRLFLSEESVVKGKNQYRLALPQQASKGIYLLRLRHGQKLYSEKLILLE